MINTKFKIIKAHPQGFCDGVVRAINKTKEALNNPNTPRPIYILGSIVHNKEISNAFRSLGLITITFDNIKDIKTGTIIISAHGVSPSVIKAIKENNVNIIDTTCKKVQFLHELVKEKINLGYDVLFMGKENHEETRGVLGISDKVHLYKESDDYSKYNKLILVCQTTLCYNDVLKEYEKIKQKYPQIEVACEICDATRLRQKAGLDASVSSDLVLVVGDRTSNNANSLVKTIKEINQNCYLIEGIKDLKEISFKNIKTVTITSAASTPRVITDEVIKTLNNIDSTDFKTKIELLDYIK